MVWVLRVRVFKICLEEVSRLKGIETLILHHYTQKPLDQGLEEVSRLKGIETMSLGTSPSP